MRNQDRLGDAARTHISFKTRMGVQAVDLEQHGSWAYENDGDDLDYEPLTSTIEWTKDGDVDVMTLRIWRLDPPYLTEDE